MFLLRVTALGWLLLVIASMAAGAEPQSAYRDALERAVAYLSREVPDWPRQNHCFSCHNNGDAARALYVARALSHAVPAEALAATTAWLLRPADWNEAKGDPGFSDLKLARIQFAAALAEAVETGAVRERHILVAAAEQLLADQESDGSWDVDVAGVVGSPATYGDVLGSYMARRALAAAGAPRFQQAIARADAWFLTVNSAATVDAAAVVLALVARLAGAGQPRASDAADEARSKLRETVVRLAESQSSDGGWGPYPKSPSEPFDTAVAVLALQAAYALEPAGSGAAPPASTDRGSSIESRIAAARGYLIRSQLPAGGWPETTRPSGFQSYAQHISTSGWVTLALLRTGEIGFQSRRNAAGLGIAPPSAHR
jgi:hypothetical protein